MYYYKTQTSVCHNYVCDFLSLANEASISADLDQTWKPFLQLQHCLNAVMLLQFHISFVTKNTKEAFIILMAISYINQHISSTFNYTTLMTLNIVHLRITNRLTEMRKIR